MVEETTTLDLRVELLKESVANAPVVWKEGYPYFVHPLSDGVPDNLLNCSLQPVI